MCDFRKLRSSTAQPQLNTVQCAHQSHWEYSCGPVQDCVTDTDAGIWDLFVTAAAAATTAAVRGQLRSKVLPGIDAAPRTLPAWQWIAFCGLNLTPI